MVQKGPDGPKRGPKWSKRLRLTILVPFGLNIFAVEVEQQNSIWNILMIEVTNFGHEKVPKFTLTALCPTMPNFKYWIESADFSIV